MSARGFISLLFAALALAGRADYGACTHVTRRQTFPLRDKVFPLMRSAGMTWARCDFDWFTMKPRPADDWKFDAFDQVIASAERNGIQLLPILCGVPGWAKPPLEHRDEFGDYVRAFAKRYAKRFPVIEIWNEPNLNMFWPGASPDTYFLMLKTAADAIRSEAPGVKVAISGFSDVPLKFIERLYQLGAKDCFDIMNVHPYTNPLPPEGILDRRLEQLRALMVKHGDGKKPVWITELGWPTQPVLRPNERHFPPVTEAEQAELLARAMGICFAEGVQNFFWYEFHAPERKEDDPESYFGFVHKDTSPKPAYDAYRHFTQVRPTGSKAVPRLWRQGKWYFPQWKRPDGKPAGMIWRIPKGGGSALDKGVRFVGRPSFTDHLGKPVKVKSKNGVYEIPAQTAPLFFTGATVDLKGTIK